MDTAFTINADLKRILDGWKTHPRIPLNIFRLVSDIYHRENLHSDIIRTLLEPDTHPASIRLFIQLLNSLEPKLGLNSDLYADAKVEREWGRRERGRVDILVHSPKNKRCVIVENKIHDAIDQEEQLSSYFTPYFPNKLHKQELVAYNKAA